ncbi:MAG: hypothetical protein JWN21_497 [Sphingomonas bacterium]|uniref:hypothetical protein n=1 Tax=Sphingomonas bacterium TaxID=1895847 RepID=UPI002614441C|nr:hypothetical protein [Sphingomonas bacterium]MDB5694954.1 hypothetical protein [Sphingomonas bacterium]
MRYLELVELSMVSGTGDSPTAPSCECPQTKTKTKRGKGNNGFGNGSDAPNLAAPGGSGDTPGDKDFSQVR